MANSTTDSSYASDEETPLLTSTSTRHEPAISSFPRPNLSSRQSSFINLPQTHSPRVITGILLFVLFVLAFGDYLMKVPAIRILEDIICHHYYDRLEGEGRIGLERDIDESMCKGDEIQNQLSVLVAGLQIMGAIPSLLATLPFGLLADRVGRKPVFLLAIYGILMAAFWQLTVMWFWRSLPLWLVLIGPIFMLIGGGESVAGMCFYTITCDITLEANRANVFMLGVSMSLVAELIAPTFSAILMKNGPWLSVFVGVAVLLAGAVLLPFIPETLHMRPRACNPSHLTPSASNVHLNEDASIKEEPTSFMAELRKEFAKSISTLAHSLSILRSTPILLLLLTFVIQPFSRQSVELSLRYVSTRFRFPLRYSQLLLSLRAGVNVFLLLVIIPLLSYFLTKRLHFSSPRKDLYLARSSMIILTIGILIIAASPTLPLTIFGMAIFTLGTGYIALTRSLITTLVDREHIAQLYAQIAVVEVIGALISSPMLAKLYIMGLKMKGAWVGLPFFGVGGIYVCAAVGIWVAGWIMERRGWEDKVDAEEREEAVEGDLVRVVVEGRMEPRSEAVTAV